MTTDANGRASVTFTLADDITSWRISGAAITADLRVGQSSVSVAAGLPLFIEAPVAPDYLVSDRPTLLVRAYGTALASGQAVTYTVSAPTLGLAPTSVVGSAFTAAAVPLPPLRPGEHDVRIEARAGSGSAVVRDTLVRKLRVVESRFTQTRSAHVVLPAGLPQATGTGMATYVFADEGRGRYLWPVQELAWEGGDRVDQALAALIARDVLRESFGIDEGVSSGSPYAVERYQKSAPPVDGRARRAPGSPFFRGAPPRSRCPPGSASWRGCASARGTSRSSSRPSARIRRGRGSRRTSPSPAWPASATPSRKEVAAALGDPALTVRERLYLALAAAILGDHPTALAAERALLETYGQRFGPWVRLRVGSTENDVLEATSLVALIAVTVGDPIAEAAEAYVDEHFTREDLYDLQKAAFLRAAIERAPASAARFSYTLAGASRVVDLGPGETFSLALTPVQRATLSARTLRGRIGVTASWEEPVSPSSVARDPTLSLTRTITPASPVPAGSVVKVTLTPRFGELTIGGCYRVVDLAPSGLLPLTWAWGGTHGSEDVTPSEIRGQRVVFCTGPWWSLPPQLVYYARVVNPGTYAWEPAIMQARRAAESAALTPADSVVIR